MSTTPHSTLDEGSTNVDEVIRWIDAGRTVQVWDPQHECWTLATHQDRGSVRYWIREGGAFRVVPGVHDRSARRDASEPTLAEQAADLTQEVERLSAEVERLHALTEGDPTSIYAEAGALRGEVDGLRAENERLREALRIEERFQRVSGNGRQADALAAILDGTTDWPTTPAWSQSETAPTPPPPDVDRLRSALRDIAAIADRAKAWNIKARQDVLDICAASLPETGGEES